MKIAIVVMKFPPKWLAGTEIAAYHIAKKLAIQGHEVHVVTSMDKGFPQNKFDEGFFVHRVLLPRVRIVGGLVFWVLAFSKLLRIKPEIVQAQSVGMGVPGLFLKIALGTPYIVWGQGNDVYQTPLSMKLISRIIMKHCEVAIALTEHMKQEMQKTAIKKTITIPNGIDFENYHLINRKESRLILNIAETEKIIGFVGRFRPEKGIEYLINAMSIIAKNQKVKLLLIGEGPEERKLRILVQRLELVEHVDFLGQVSNIEIPKYLAAMDVFILPSLSEAFGIVLIEAMATGVPIVASDVRGLSEIVEDGKNGFLVPPKDSRQIAERILFLLDDDELRDRISDFSKETAKQYSWNTIVRRLNELYQGIRK